MSVESEASPIEKAFQALLRGEASDLDAHLNSVSSPANLTGTKANLHCHHIHLDGNGGPKIKHLADFLVNRVTEYAIPRVEIERAKKKDQASNSTAAISELHRRAVRLFVDSDGSGEGGELLLYCMIQAKLRMPQLLCKMSLKTNSNVHYHGADGIHAGIDSQTGQLAFYWGESKFHKNVGSAISDCLDSLLPFLHEPPGVPGQPRRERDLELVRADLSKLDDKVLEDALLNYLNPDHSDFNKVNFRGACMIGFDCDKYPVQPNQITSEKLCELVKTELEGQWTKKVGDGILGRKPLETFQLEVFLVPVPEVEAFRSAFAESLKR